MHNQHTDDQINGLEAWRRVWRQGIALSLSTPGLLALRQALVTNDPRLVQGYTAFPVANAEGSAPPAAACPLGFAGWQGDGLETIDAIEEAFARTCLEADQRLNEPAAARWFIGWVDETPLEIVRAELLPEIDRELTRRGVHV
jgi:hypothetical protein